MKLFSSTVFSLLLASTLLSESGLAAPRTFALVAPAAGRTGIEFSIGYTAGTHEGRAESVSGQATIDLEDFSASTALFSVPLSAMNTGNAKRDCHMREALGLNYAVSKYPEGGHVCSSSQMTPATGPDSVVFDKVTFLLKGMTNPDGSRIEGLTPGVPTPVLATVDWNLHGVSRTQNEALVVTLENNDRIRIGGSSKLVLKDFGVEVLPFLIITVSEFATAKYDVVLQAR
jgi:polyisoprenoid-binding protein YceI